MTSLFVVLLSQNLEHSPYEPMQATLAVVEPHGAIALHRFTDGERVVSFDMVAAELEALIATNRRRKALVGRYHAERTGSKSLIEDLGDLGKIPF